MCLNCLGFGHLAKKCRNATKCSTCGAEGPHQCDKVRRCGLCGDNHRTTSRDCPRYIEESEIVNIAYNRKVDTYEARQIWRSTRSSASYARVASSMKNPMRTESQRGPTPQEVSRDPSCRTKRPRAVEERSTKDVTTSRPDSQQTNATVHRTPEGTPVSAPSLQISVRRPKPKKVDLGEQAVELSNPYSILAADEDDDESEIQLPSHSSQSSISAKHQDPNLKGGLAPKGPEPKQRRTTAKRSAPPQMKYHCEKCNKDHKTEKCLQKHKSSFHRDGEWMKHPTRRCEKRIRDHRCSLGQGDECSDLTQYKTLDTNVRTYVDDGGVKKYVSPKMFRIGISSGTITTSQEIEHTQGKLRIICDCCVGYEAKTQKCLKKHKQSYHQNQEFVKGYRPRDHRCHWDGECVELLEEQSRDAENKFRDSDGKYYKDIGEFRENNPITPEKTVTGENVNQPEKGVSLEREAPQDATKDNLKKKRKRETLSPQIMEDLQGNEGGRWVCGADTPTGVEFESLICGAIVDPSVRRRSSSVPAGAHQSTPGLVASSTSFDLNRTASMTRVQQQVRQIEELAEDRDRTM